MKTPFLHVLALVVLFVAGVATASGAPASFAYDANDLLVQVNYGDGRQVNYAYDEMGNLLSVKTRNASPPVVIVNAVASGTVGVPLADYLVQLNSAVGILGYSAVSLPPGLKFNAGIAMNADGKLPGTLYGTPTTGGVFKVTLTARNITGTSTPAILVIRIANPFTDVTDGFTLSGSTNNVSGFIAVSAIVGDELGGEITLKVATGGVITGTLKLGTKSWAFTGKIDPLTGVANAITIARPGVGNLTLNLQLALSGDSRGSLTGTLKDAALTTAAVTASTNTWSATHKASVYSGAVSTRYNVGLPLNLAKVGDVSVPQGSGYCSITVGTTGVATVAGMLADGTAFTKAPVVWADGTVPVYVLLYTSKGYVAGTLALGTGLDLLSTADNTATGGLSWVRPVTAGQVYPGGFTAPVDALGGAFVAPATGYRLLDLGNGVTHALVNLTWSKAWLAGDITSALTISTANLVTAFTPKLYAQTLTMVKTTGAFSGKFTVAAPTRVVSYQGMLIPAVGTGTAAGYGWFLMPQTTPTSSQLSGKALIARP